MDQTTYKTLGINGQELIKQAEGLRLVAYKDSVGIWTIGWGHTGEDVHEGMSCSLEQAQQWFDEDTTTAVKAVNQLVEVAVSQNQFDALVSWTYNLGAGNLAQSAMLRMLNAGDYRRVPIEMLRWDKAGGEVQKGLMVRRQAEAKLFRTED